MRPAPVGVAMFSVNDLDDLVLLQRAVAAARFVSRESEVLPGSPRMAWLHSQIVDAILAAAGGTDADDPNGWAEWRRLSNNPAHAESVVTYLASIEQFSEWSRNERAAYAKVCVSPFEASDDEIDVLLERAARAAAG